MLQAVFRMMSRRRPSAQNAGREAGRSELTTVHFLHIGKNAGSQIFDLSKRLNSSSSRYRIRSHGHDVFLRNLPKKDPYFFSVRDPISRFRSGFYSRKRRGRPRYDSPWSIYEQVAFERFEHANDLAEALFSEGDLGYQAFCAMKSIRHTAQNQVDWFYGCGFLFEARPPLWILRQEHFDDDLTGFLRLLGVEGSFQTASKDTKVHKNQYEDVPDLSARARSNLSRWYVQDSEFYRMCESWIKDKSIRG